MDFKLMNEKQHLVTLLQLLIFVRGLTYTPGKLDTKYRKFTFPLREFLNYTKKATNQYQLNKLKDFFDLLKENFIIESFSNRYYQMLVTISEVKVTKSEQNIWNAEIWITKELFDYLHPFIFPDLFKSKLPSYQFRVLFKVIKVYCSNDTRKEFKIQTFLESCPSKLNGEQKKQIKKYFRFSQRLAHVSALLSPDSDRARRALQFASVKSHFGFTDVEKYAKLHVENNIFRIF